MYIDLFKCGKNNFILVVLESRNVEITTLERPSQASKTEFANSFNNWQGRFIFNAI